MSDTFERDVVRHLERFSGRMHRAAVGWDKIAECFPAEQVESETAPLTLEQFVHLMNFCLDPEIKDGISNILTGEGDVEEVFERCYQKLINVEPYIQVLAQKYIYFKLHLNAVFKGLLMVAEVRRSPSIVQGLFGFPNET